MTLESATQRIVTEFALSDEQVNSGVSEFLSEMDAGLKGNSNLSQIPTYVTGVPNGSEKGVFLAVDLGGTNFRVCSVKLNGDHTFNLTYSKVAIPARLMVATATDLFGFLADQIRIFLEEHHASQVEMLRLGFTFSFPVNQVGINKGTLIRWTKGFDIPDAVGQDVCALLQREIDRLGLPVKVAALVNDTVGTLMSRSYTSHGDTKSVLGAIFGTGTNGAYIEKLGRISKPMQGSYDSSSGEMVVNTEWGSFDNGLKVLPNTRFDAALDRASNNPGIQMFEKRVSGMFLGEILRHAVLELRDSSLFSDTNSASNDWTSTTSIDSASPIFKPHGVDSSILSVAASDNTPELSLLRQELEKTLKINSPSLQDARAFKAVAEAIGRRAARLSAVAIGAIVLQSGQLDHDVVDVGVDGSLVEHYPLFRDMIYEALRTVEGIGEKASRIRIGIAKDGSGVGAALIALMAGTTESKVGLLAQTRHSVNWQYWGMLGMAVMAGYVLGRGSSRRLMA